MTRPLFISGLARSGTSLVARMIDANPNAAISIDAFLPLFRALRNSIALSNEPNFDPSLAMQDGYFSQVQRRQIEQLWHGNLDCPLAGTDLTELKEALTRRASDESGDLVPHLESLEGDTLGEIFESALGIIARARLAPESGIVGMKDLWAIDLLPALAHSLPQAHFLIVLRDPRDMVTSILGFLEIDPSQVAHILSAVRHWRKTIATLHAYRQMPLFDDRLETVRYEDIVADPDTFADDICTFLAIDPDPAMLQVKQFRDYNSDKSWRGNSTFDAEFTDISARPHGRWREKLAPEVLTLVELACGPEMADVGYEPSLTSNQIAGSPETLAFLIADGRRACSWRSDSGDALCEFERESARQGLLALSADDLDGSTIEDAFLFKSYFEHLKEQFAAAT